MKKIVCGLLGAAALICVDSLAAPGVHATGSRLHGSGSSSKTTLLSRSYRWKWDPFRVEGDNAYAVAYVTNNHGYALTLKTYCKVDGEPMQALSGWHLIKPGETLQWDTRNLLDEAGETIDTVVSCRFWIDGSIDLRGKVVNLMPARMGGKEGDPPTVITFNYKNFGPKG